MSDTKKKIKNIRDKSEGEIKETIGKVTGNQELELEGKLKKKGVDAKEKISDLKEDILGKINDKIDKTDEKKKSKKSEK